MYSQKSKLNKRSIRIALAVGLVALVAGIYFAFKPFPAGPSIEVAANVLEESGVKAVVPAGYAYESGAPLHYSGKVIALGAAFVPSSSIPPQYRRWFRFETGAPLHYSGKVIAPGAASVPSSAVPPQYRRWFRFESDAPSAPSSSIPQHYIDAGYALKQMP